MRSLVVQALTAVLLLVAGSALGVVGLAERRLTAAYKELQTLQYAASANQYAQIEESLRLAARVPGLLPDLQGAAQAGRAAARYWQADYSALAPASNAARPLPEGDPDVSFLAANAMYRSIPLDGDRQAALQRIDAVLKRYVDLLKREPAQVDAAYNFEYVARLRDQLARARQVAGKSGRAQPAAASPSGPAVGDLPVGPTLHGHPGAPPRNAAMGEFKTVIPRQKEERADDPDAAKGTQKVRKG
jgi:hypothetical protein